MSKELLKNSEPSVERLGLAKEAAPDFIVDLDRETENMLGEFGLSIEGSLVKCQPLRPGGFSWVHDFSSGPEKVIRDDRDELPGGLQMAPPALKTMLGPKYFPNVTNIRLRYQKRDKSVLPNENLYEGEDYIDYEIIFKDSKENIHNHIERNGYLNLMWDRH